MKISRDSTPETAGVKKVLMRWGNIKHKWTNKHSKGEMNNSDSHEPDNGIILAHMMKHYKKVFEHSKE